MEVQAVNAGPARYESREAPWSAGDGSAKPGAYRPGYELVAEQILRLIGEKPASHEGHVTSGSCGCRIRAAFAVEASVPREKRKPKGSGKTPQEWGIVVRREDGTQLHYFVNERHVDSRGKPLEFGAASRRRTGSRPRSTRVAEPPRCRRTPQRRSTPSCGSPPFHPRASRRGCGHQYPSPRSSQAL